MHTLDNYHGLMARTDAGYGLLFASVVVGLVVGAGLARRWSQLPALAFGLYSFSLLLINPLAAAAAGAAVVAARCICRVPLPCCSVVYSVGLGFILRLPVLFDNLWYDETFTAAVAQLPLDRLPAAILGDVHPPINYLISWLIARVFGASELALRLPALAFGVLLIWLVYRLALALQLDKQAALVASLLVAVLPAAIYYSAEARQYSLLACLAVGLLIAILESRWLLIAALGAALAWTHSLGMVYLVVIGAAALLLYPSRRLLVALLVAGLGAGLWLPFLMIQSGDVANGFWLHPLTVAGALWPVADMTVTARLPESFVLHTYTVVMALTVVSLVVARRWLLTRPGGLLLALVVGVPVAVALASVLWRPVYLTRSLLPCALLLTIFWSRLLVVSHLARWFAVVALVVGLVGIYSPDAARMPIESYLQDCAGADAVYVVNTSAHFLASYYLPDMSLFAWSESDDLNQALPVSAKQAFGFRLVNSIASAGSGVVCLVLWDSPMTTDRQRRHVQAVLDRYPHTAHEIEVNNVFQLNIYKVSINNGRYSAKQARMS